MVDVAANTRTVLARIQEAAAKCGRDPATIKLLAASKSQSTEKIRAAIAAGVRLFGENYVQEAKDKREAVKEGVEWHMIGHLQRNKVKAALDLFDLIESLDNVALAKELDKEGKKRGRKVAVFVEVNLAGEESKTGIDKDRLVPLLEEVGKLSHLSVEGLMAVPPFRENPEAVRPYFRALRELQSELSRLKIPNVELKELSMGMTHDFAVAIEEGATIVRIGTALFGPRED
ncbi:MAG: YggS family pyridoxal phosphate-dependent enzyme [Deltaproteobacteria bacterium]|nr:YggS family pyridoxal phosphate-dependent enzyme [Deltaproteobacteria bacterium]